jgi:hypothetical protein
MKLADAFLYLGLTATISGAAAIDWRVGLIVGGVLFGVAGILLSLR